MAESVSTKADADLSVFLSPLLLIPDAAVGTKGLTERQARSQPSALPYEAVRSLFVEIAKFWRNLVAGQLHEWRDLRLESLPR